MTNVNSGSVDDVSYEWATLYCPELREVYQFPTKVHGLHGWCNWRPRLVEAVKAACFRALFPSAEQWELHRDVVKKALGA